LKLAPAGFRFRSWPSAESLVADLVTALAEAEDREADPEKKRRLRQARNVVGGTERQLLIAVAAQKLGHQI
jgi:hypothetical protein